MTVTIYLKLKEEFADCDLTSFGDRRIYKERRSLNFSCKHFKENEDEYEKSYDFRYCPKCGKELARDEEIVRYVLSKDGKRRYYIDVEDYGYLVLKTGEEDVESVVMSTKDMQSTLNDLEGIIESILVQYYD